ncbi:MAG TPA: hypothetical protein PKB06_01010, partial [Actinotalea sp.]|nr:hypothetical protein [Actinotalea sp.]
MSTHYVPGDGLAVVVHGTVAFLPDGGDQATVEALWQSLSAGGTMTDHLQVLLAPGLAAAPSFGLVRVSDGVAHVVVRGSATAIAATRSGERVVGAAHVSTWTEESLAEVSAVRVAGRRAGVGGPLPVSVAVVPAAEVTLDATTGAVVVVADAAAADAVMTVPVVAPPVV